MCNNNIDIIYITYMLSYVETENHCSGIFANRNFFHTQNLALNFETNLLLKLQHLAIISSVKAIAMYVVNCILFCCLYNV